MSPATGEDRRAALRAIGDVLGTVADGLLDRGLGLEEALQVFEARYIRSAVDRASGNVSQAAVTLGIHRNTLRTKLQKNGQRHRRRA